MGWFSSASTLAMAVGPMFAIWITQNLTFNALFLSAAGLSAAALLLMFGAKVPHRQQSGVRTIGLFEKSVLPVTIPVFFMYIAYGGITAFVPLFTNSIKVNSGAFFLAYAATLALSRPVSGKASDRYGQTFVIVPALIITISALIVLSFSTGLPGVLVSAVLYGIGFGSAQPALQAATIVLAHPERKGVANASLLTATDLGIGLDEKQKAWPSEFRFSSL